MNASKEGAITDPKERYKAGVLKYEQMGYWQPDYEPKDTDMICVFRITPQEGVDPTRRPRRSPANRRRRPGPWSGPTADRVRRATAPRPTASTACPTPARHESEQQYFAYVAYDLILFEEGSIANLTASIIGNVFSFKPLKAARLEDMRHARSPT